MPNRFLPLLRRLLNVARLLLIKRSRGSAASRSPAVREPAGSTLPPPEGGPPQPGPTASGTAPMSVRGSTEQAETSASRSSHRVPEIGESPTVNNGIGDESGGPARQQPDQLETETPEPHSPGAAEGTELIESKSIATQAIVPNAAQPEPAPVSALDAVPPAQVPLGAAASRATRTPVARTIRRGPRAPPEVDPQLLLRNITGASPLLSEQYAAWNKVLVERFFSSDRSGSPAFLSLDDTEVSDIKDHHGFDASLDEAVRQLAPEGSATDAALRLGRDWARAEYSGDPPFVAFLAVCVLAASRMGGDGAPSHNYYRWLNDLLERERAGPPKAFDKVEALWGILNHWLSVVHEGSRGSPTARQVGGHSHIGWPLSQALVRRADFRELAWFVDWIGFESEESLPAVEIERALPIWLREEGAHTRLARLLGASPAQGDVHLVATRILAAFPDLTAILDSVPPASEERRSSERKSELHLYQMGVTWNAVGAQVAWRSDPVEDEIEDEAPISVRAPGDLESLSVTRDADWACVDAAPQDVIARGAEFRAVGFDRKYRLTPENVFVFGRGETRGRRGWWVQLPGLGSVGEEILVAAHPSERDEVLSALAACATGWTETHDVPWLPPGWILFSGAKVITSIDGVLGGRSADADTEWALIGGIRVRRDTWLLGYEPRLEAPSDAVFRLESAQGDFLFAVNGGTPLGTVLKGPGSYRIAPPSGPSRAIITTAPTWPPHPLAHFTAQEFKVGTANRGTVSGAFVEGLENLAAPLVVPPRGKVILIGARPGDLRAIKGHRRNSIMVEPTTDFDAQWAVIVRGGKPGRLVCLRATPSAPIQSAGVRGATRAWRDAVLAGGNQRLRGLKKGQRATFDLYIEHARRLR